MALEVEVGCGKGAFLVEEAPLRPLDRFVGLETRPAVAAYAADRLRRRGIANAEVLRLDAVTYAAALPDASVGRFWILFPDPWPKRRHAKRRLFRRPGFSAHLARALVPGGEIVVVTDVGAYADEIESRLARDLSVRRDSPLETPRTNFWRKFALEGRAFHRIVATKQAS